MSEIHEFTTIGMTTKHGADIANMWAPYWATESILGVPDGPIYGARKQTGPLIKSPLRLPCEQSTWLENCAGLCFALPTPAKRRSNLKPLPLL